MAVMMRSMLEVADNSGARKLQMIHAAGRIRRAECRLGDIITAAVKEAVRGPDEKGSVVKAVIVRTRKEHRRRDGHLHPLRPECPQC